MPKYGGPGPRAGSLRSDLATSIYLPSLAASKNTKQGNLFIHTPRPLCSAVRAFSHQLPSRNRSKTRANPSHPRVNPPQGSRKYRCQCPQPQHVPSEHLLWSNLAMYPTDVQDLEAHRSRRLFNLRLTDPIRPHSLSTQTLPRQLCILVGSPNKVSQPLLFIIETILFRLDVKHINLTKG